MEDKICYSGLTAGGLLQAALICLKAANLTTWSWWVIFIPLWIGIVLTIFSLCLVGYLLYVDSRKEKEAPVEESKEDTMPLSETTTSSTSEVPVEKMTKPVAPRSKPKKKVIKVEEVVPIEDSNKITVDNNTEKEPAKTLKVTNKESKKDEPKEVKPKAKKTKKSKADGEATKSTSKGNSNQ